MTRNELELWIENNKNIKENRFEELAGDFASRIIRGLLWSGSKERDEGKWSDLHNHMTELAIYQTSVTELSIIFFLEDTHKDLEIASIELTLMFNWRKSEEGFDYWKEWCISIYKESTYKES